MSSFNLPTQLPEAILGATPATTTVDCFLPVLQTDVLSCGPTARAGASGFSEGHGISHGCHAHRRHKRKHRREDKGEDSDHDECCQPKRFLSEEAMSACLQQLNLTSSAGRGPAPDFSNALLSSHVLSNQLSIRTVASCSGSLDQRTSCSRPSPPMEGSPSSECHKRKADPGSPTSPHPLKLQCSNSGSGSSDDGGPGGSGSKHLSHLAPGVQIKVTPATPTSVAPTRHHHYQPPKHLPRSSPLSLRHPSGKNWDAILEDISSDSSDGMETSESDVHPRRPTVWLAPEIRNGLASYKKDQLLPQPILEEINKKGRELVPWVGPERYLLNIQRQNEDTQEMSDVQSEGPAGQSNRGCSPESIEEDKSVWDYDQLEMEA